jgi:hypothetical protein
MLINEIKNSDQAVPKSVEKNATKIVSEEPVAASPEQIDPISRAIAMMLACVREGRKFKIQDLAKAVGVHRSTLKRNPSFNAALEAARQRMRVPRGHKDENGNIDAEDED